jgi:hypothetical protein
MAKAQLSILCLFEAGSLHKQPKNQCWVSLGLNMWIDFLKIYLLII